MIECAAPNQATRAINQFVGRHRLIEVCAAIGNAIMADSYRWFTAIAMGAGRQRDARAEPAIVMDHQIHGRSRSRIVPRTLSLWPTRLCTSIVRTPHARRHDNKKPRSSGKRNRKLGKSLSKPMSSCTTPSRTLLAPRCFRAVTEARVRPFRPMNTMRSATCLADPAAAIVRH